MNLSRRRFLGTAGALAGGALLAACGREIAGRPVPPDTEVLAGLLAAERSTQAAMAGARGLQARALRDQDRRHAERLARELERRGESPAPASAGDPGDPLARKQEGVYTYVDALPRLADPDLRVLVMQLAASEAAHLAALRLAAGEEPVPDAFAGFVGGAGT